MNNQIEEKSSKLKNSTLHQQIEGHYELSYLNTDEWEKWCPPIKRNIDGSCREEL